MTIPTTDPQSFRALLGCFATGVTVATTVDPAGRDCGMTASAIAAVSLEPPLLLICVDRDAKFHAAVGFGRAFALNILAADQEHVSETFASKAADPFADIEFHREPGGLLLLDGVVAHIMCEFCQSYEAGDHTVFFGTVTHGVVFNRHPLLHFRSGYATIAADSMSDGQVGRPTDDR